MTTAILPLTDFPDRLSPMVVKELRQGLRTRAFASTLLLLHGLLIITTLITGSASNADDTRWMFDGLATLVLCLIMPFRVTNALAEEVKLNTLDMLMLTRLSCSRIVFGKWASVALQACLIALSLMPYVVARYVFGGLELTAELLALGSKWLMGIVFAAALVALSTIRQSWLRMVLIIVPLFFGGFGLIGFLAVSVGGRSVFGAAPAASAGLELAAICGYLASAAWAIFACLSLAASRISPPSEPLAWIKRSVHVVAFLVPIIIYLITRQAALLLQCFPVLAVLTLDALTETQNDVPSAYVPFYRRGLFGRLMIGLFSPGWASGFWLSFVVAAGIATALALTGGTGMLPYFVLAACSVWMISAIIQMLPTRHSNDLLPIFLGLFALMYLITGMFSGLGVIVAKSAGEQPWFLTVLPPAAIIGAQSISGAPEREKFLQTAMLFASVWPLLHAVLSVRAWRALSPIRAEARELAAGRP